MTTIPVVWLARDHPESGNLRRGWWDQTLLADMLDGKLGRFPHGLRFEHFESGGGIVQMDEGAVVVLPGRFHADAEGVAWVNAAVANLPWVVLVVTSDEESLMPWWEIDHPRLKVWIMTPRPQTEVPVGTQLPYMLGEGYGPGTREALAEIGDSDADGAERPIDVGFAGQITHERRTVWTTPCGR